MIAALGWNTPRYKPFRRPIPTALAPCDKSCVCMAQSAPKGKAKRRCGVGAARKPTATRGFASTRSAERPRKE
jgi:hypothetical protein